MAQVAILKKYSIKCKRKDLDCELFYSELKRHNVSYIAIYTDNHRVENIISVLIKDLKSCKC